MEISKSEEYLGFPFLIAVRRKFKWDDPFFAAGNIERELLAKQVALDLSEDERHELQKLEDSEHTVYCPIAGCGARLNCLEDFEDHYHARHTASCSVCSRVFPTSRLLGIHVSESHDSFFKAKVARGFPMYECLVEGCGLKFKSYKSRQQHLVQKHKFPTSFEFFKKAKPSKHQRLKSQRKQSKSFKGERNESGMEVDDNKISKKTGNKEGGRNESRMEIEGEVDKLASAVSMLSTSDSTPSSINFGHRHSRAFGLVPRSVKQNVKQPSRSEPKT